ncbi:zinc ribbon domain-containing protein [Bradyrhizobium barranii]|jgi:hypothetical protein|uniref:zinc ribbon domain-containing protein n=1 Tax=Bradyrhizobium TaxID=374 RepID=UPI0033982770
MAPVENLFPAAVDADIYWRVNRKLITKAARGRNARQLSKSIVSGIIFCATCGHAVTRVAKGDYVYLVCSRANMRAEGCDYRAVRYTTRIRWQRIGRRCWRTRSIRQSRL